MINFSIRHTALVLIFCNHRDFFPRLREIWNPIKNNNTTIRT